MKVGERKIEEEEVGSVWMEEEKEAGKKKVGGRGCGF